MDSLILLGVYWYLHLGIKTSKVQRGMDDSMIISLDG